MNRKAVTVVLVAVVCAGIAAYALTRTAPEVAAPTQQASSTTQAATTSSSTASTSQQDIVVSSTTTDGAYTWIYAEAPDNEVTMDLQTHVYLSYAGNRYDGGTYQGSCHLLEPDIFYAANQRSGVRCWYAGGGDEVGVFEENGRLVLKHGVVEEGTDEYPGFRGDFRTIAELQ